MTAITVPADMLKSLSGRDLPARVRTIHKLASPHAPSSASFDQIAAPQRPLAELCRSWWYLLKENAFLLKDSFVKFTDRLADLLGGSAAYGDLARHFKGYLCGGEVNFRQLHRHAIRIEVEGGGGIVCACCPDDMLLVVSGRPKTKMPDYDLTALGANREWLFGCYESLIRTVPDCQICLVEKSVGPFGPIRHAREIAELAGKDKVFAFTQFGNRVIDGDMRPDMPILILYDLYATGMGLKEVAASLRGDFALRNDMPIYAGVVHVFHGEEREVEAPTAMFNDFTPFGRGSNGYPLDGVVALHRGEFPENARTHDFSKGNADFPEEFKGLFKNHQPEEIFADFTSRDYAALDEYEGILQSGIPDD